MEYSIGGLSDLINGTDTPNKSKLVKKTITPKKDAPLEEKILKTDPNVSPKKSRKSLTPSKSSKNNKTPTKGNAGWAESTEEVSVPGKSPGKSPGKKANKRKLPTQEESPVKEANETLPTDEEESPAPKKSKNDENAERRVKKKAQKQFEEDPELTARTIYIGNVPVTTEQKDIEKLFKQYGKIEAVRFRGVPVPDMKTPKRVAFMKKEFHPDRKTFICFIRFAKLESAENATIANGVSFNEHHLVVKLSSVAEERDESKAIFVGNLSFKADEEELWKIFEVCGAIESVRIVRNRGTGMGKGFGYVNFESSDSVSLALEMGKVELNGREIRISACNVAANKKDKKKTPKKGGTPRKGPFRGKTVEGTPTKSPGQKFQGVKAGDQQKKKKFNKGLNQKQKLVKQIAPK